MSIYQVVTVYAGQRVLEGNYDTLPEAKQTAEDAHIDAPIEVVDTRTSMLKGWVDAKGWHSAKAREMRPVEAGE